MNLKIVCVILLVLSSCARVKITDTEFCGDMGRDGAKCFTTLSGQERTIELREWEDYRFGMICSKASTFAEWKKAILKLCKMSRRCYFSTQKKINEFGENVESIEVKINELQKSR